MDRDLSRERPIFENLPKTTSCSMNYYDLTMYNSIFQKNKIAKKIKKNRSNVELASKCLSNMLVEYAFKCPQIAKNTPSWAVNAHLCSWELRQETS